VTYPSTTFSDARIGNPPHGSSCEKLKDLGYVAGERVTLYGEQFEIVSDPFIDGNWVAVSVTGEDDPTVQTIRLPVSILLGLTGLLPKNTSQAP
jgi:hypothetical protein